MADWHFWGEKRFSDIYENIYIRTLNEDWYTIIFEVARRINAHKKEKKLLLDVGCGEGHTTKQILDRIVGEYSCDLLEPNQQALINAVAFLKQENTVGKAFVDTLKNFSVDHTYDIIFTSHTNYYWATNKEDFDAQLDKLVSLLDEGGKLFILTLPENSDHYNVMLHEVYPTFNYAEYINEFYRRKDVSVEVKELEMKMYVGDIVNTAKVFDRNNFYKFIHNTDKTPSTRQSAEFLEKIIKYQKDNYLNFRDYLIVITK